jgi:hypothetical protein
MGTFANIQVALDTRLSTLSGLPAVAWPNVATTPAEGTTYLRPTLLPAASQLGGLTDNRVHKGIYQIDIFVQLEKGASALLALQDSITTHFEADRDLVVSGTTVFIQAVSPSRGIRDDSWYMGFVEINYICYS